MGRGRANAIACDLLDEAGEAELLGVITRERTSSTKRVRLSFVISCSRLAWEG